jgi:hypothetical protein
MLAYSGQGQFVISKINLTSLVREMVHILEVSVSKRALLQYDFAENLPPVCADATQMRQVIMNLIVNASEALGEQNGVIRIATDVMHCDTAYLSQSRIEEHLPEGRYVYLEVTDNGCGMDEKVQSRIFEPFFTTKFTGRGLGMAAVLGIVQDTKGRCASTVSRDRARHSGCFSRRPKDEPISNSPAQNTNRRGNGTAREPFLWWTTKRLSETRPRECWNGRVSGFFWPPTASKRSNCTESNTIRFVVWFWT